MNVIIRLIFIVLGLMPFLVLAQEAPAPAPAPATPPASASPNSHGGRTIVIQDPTGRQHSDAPKVFVEPGTETISGSPEESLKGAYRTWEQACRAWKNEMNRLNGKNLIQASCGSPKKHEEVVQSQRFYTYRSDAKFKVRVIGK